MTDILKYNGMLVALVKPCISIDEDFGNVFKSFHETNRLMCGLFYVKVEKDQFTDTVHLFLKPTYRFHNYFNEFTKDILYNENDLVVVEGKHQRYFYHNELFKAYGFVDYINKLISYKYKVESYPNKFYIKYYNRKMYFKSNNWYLDESLITNDNLLDYLFKADWEYRDDEIQLKRYNIFHRFFSIFKKTDNILTNKI